MDNQINYLKFAWWNTSLAPLGKYRGKEEDTDLANYVISELLSQLTVDFLALGEIDKKYLENISKNIGEDYSTLDLTLSEGRLNYDIGVIYKKDKFKIINTLAITSEYAHASLKVAIRLDVLVPNSDKLLYLFLIHWPSRLWCHENSVKRNKLGDFLRDATEAVASNYGYFPQIMIIGDFNDDPFDQSLSGYLLATRDRSLARNSSGYFYNPFWRIIGESLPHKPNIKCDSICGTYVQKYGGNVTRWWTFDQIILSPIFLKTNEWQLNEEQTNIVRINYLDEAVRKNESIFDHLPIIATFEYYKERSGENG